MQVGVEEFQAAGHVFKADTGFLAIVLLPFFAGIMANESNLSASLDEFYLEKTVFHCRLDAMLEGVLHENNKQ